MPGDNAGDAKRTGSTNPAGSVPFAGTLNEPRGECPATLSATPPSTPPLIIADIETKGLATFFVAARSYLRGLFLAGAITLNGELTPAGRSALADAEAAQLAYLDKFERAAADGSQPPDGTFANRAAMYGSAAWAVAHAVEAAEMAGGKGKAEARRILDGAASHCPDCPAEAEKGWVPIAESVPIGATECGSLCRCSVAYR